MRDPVDAVVAEAEISGDVFQTEGVPPDPSFNPAIPANVHLEHELNNIHAETDPPATASDNRETAKNYHVPLKVTRLKGQDATDPAAAPAKTARQRFQRLRRNVDSALEAAISIHYRRMDSGARLLAPYAAC